MILIFYGELFLPSFSGIDDNNSFDGERYEFVIICFDVAINV